MHVRLLGETAHPVTPRPYALGRAILEHTGMFQDESQLRQAGGEAGRARHLWRENLQLEEPAMLRESLEVAPEHWVVDDVRSLREAVEGVLVPVNLLADAPHQGKTGLLRHHLGRTLVLKIDEPHDSMGPSGALGLFLDRKSTRLNSSHANISYAV